MSMAGATHRDITVAFLVYPGVSLLDVAAPLQVLTSAGRPLRGVLVGADVAPTPTDTPVALTPHGTFADVPAPAVLVVPGGGLGLARAMVDDAVQHYLRAAGAEARIVAANGAGTLLLAAAGMLAGRRAVTHLGYRAFLERLGTPCEARPWFDDGRFVTAAGGDAGIDLMLRVVERLGMSAEAARVRAAMRPPERVEPTAPLPPFAHLTDREAQGRLAAMRLILAARPDLLERLAL
jgi:transcriptional regulator GlxA family with amidase domain